MGREKTMNFRLNGLNKPIKISETNYNNGIKHGKSYYYNENGDIIKILYYQNGRLMEDYIEKLDKIIED